MAPTPLTLQQGLCKPTLPRAQPFVPCLKQARPGRVVLARGATPELPEELAKRLQDPKVLAGLKAMMAKPEVQQQMSQMMSAYQNPAMQQKMQELKNDPELADMFADIQKNGMAAMMKYWNDPKLLAKIGQKVGDVNPESTAGQVAAAAVASGVAAPAQAIPEVDNLIDAARVGDEEAVEDFVAIGKDVNMADKEGRTPLHFAAAYGRAPIARTLIDAGAKLEVVDSMSNTPLHYAAGYGRPGMVELLLEAGASRAAKNNTGKTPAELCKLDPRNPVGQDSELLAKLAA